MDPGNFPAVHPVANYSGVDNHTSNQHRITGYLDDPVVAREIAAALGLVSPS